MMKEWNIKDIENITEKEAQEIALESIVGKTGASKSKCVKQL